MDRSPMTQNRRPGFRLPWTSEEESAMSTSPEPAADAAESGASADPEGNGAPPAPNAQDAVAAEATPSASGDPVESQPHDAPAEETAAEPPVVEAEAVAADPGAETDFMRDLVAAMRGVADEARRATTADVQSRANAQVQQLEADSERRRGELQSKADADVAGVGQWAESEAERIRAEAEQRVAARRAQLEEQLAAEAHRGEAETRAVRDRLAEYERELDAYHAQLTEISDPAAFAAAAKRMPPPPSFEAAAAAAATAPVVAPAPAPAVAPVAEHAASPDTAEAVEATDMADEPQAADEPGATDEPQGADGAGEPPVGAAGDEGVATEPVAEAAPEAAPHAEADSGEGGAIPAAMAELMPADQNGVEPVAETAPENGTLAQRLANLRAEAASGATAPAGGGSPAGESVTTEVVVRGLGSFGAITGFRQSLSNVDGIDGVSLSLGQSGEFVFRATHAPGFDVGAAIVTLEGDKAQVEPTPTGGLHVTLERAR
jgi:hypothetical protein